MVHVRHLVVVVSADTMHGWHVVEIVHCIKHVHEASTCMHVSAARACACFGACVVLCCVALTYDVESHVGVCVAHV